MRTLMVVLAILLGCYTIAYQHEDTPSSPSYLIGLPSIETEAEGEAAPRNLSNLLIAIQTTPDITSDQDLMRYLHQWFEDVKADLDWPSSYQITLDDFLPSGDPPGTATKSLEDEVSISFIEILLDNANKIAVSASVVLLSLLSNSNQFSDDVLVLLPRLVRCAEQFPYLNLGDAYVYMIDQYPSDALSSWTFIDGMLESIQSRREISPSAMELYQALASKWTLLSCLNIAERAVDYLERPLWSQIFTDAILQSLYMYHITMSTSSSSTASVFVFLRRTLRKTFMEFLAELLHRLYDPDQMAISLIYQQFRLEECHEMRFQNPVAVRTLWTDLNLALEQYCFSSDFLIALVRRLSVSGAWSIILQLDRLLVQHDAPLFVDNWQLYSVTGPIHYYLLGRTEFQSLYISSLSPERSGRVSLSLAIWKTLSLESSRPIDEIRNLLNAITSLNALRLLLVQLSSPVDSDPRTTAIRALLIHAWTYLGEYETYLGDLRATLAPSVAELADSLRQSTLKETFPLALSLVYHIHDPDEVGGHQQLSPEQVTEGRRLIWDALFAEDQIELRRSFPLFFGGFFDRSSVSQNDRDQFRARLISDLCCICLEQLSGNPEPELLVMMAKSPGDLDASLYKMPCGQHFVHRSCIQCYLLSHMLNTCRRCLICRQP